MDLSVGSEIGRLRQVILHRPGSEMLRLTPQNKDHLLFDDVLWLERAQEEHDQFARVLTDRDVEVFYLGVAISQHACELIVLLLGPLEPQDVVE